MLEKQVNRDILAIVLRITFFDGNIGGMKSEELSLTIISIIFANNSPAAVLPYKLLLLLPSKLPTQTPKT